VFGGMRALVTIVALGLFCLPAQAKSCPENQPPIFSSPAGGPDYPYVVASEIKFGADGRELVLSAGDKTEEYYFDPPSGANAAQYVSKDEPNLAGPVYFFDRQRNETPNFADAETVFMPKFSHRRMKTSTEMPLVQQLWHFARCSETPEPEPERPRFEFPAPGTPPSPPIEGLNRRVQTLTIGPDGKVVPRK
jgi:hypothetical protein